MMDINTYLIGCILSAGFMLGFIMKKEGIHMLIPAIWRSLMFGTISWIGVIALLMVWFDD